MIDFKSTRLSTPRELVPHLKLIAAIVAQAVSDASADPVYVKGNTEENRKEKSTRAREVEDNAQSAIAFLFGHGDGLNIMAGIIGFDADDLRRAMVSGKSNTLGKTAFDDKQRRNIRRRLGIQKYDLAQFC